MSDLPTMVPHPVRQADDRDTHIERINGKGNPADGPEPLPATAPAPDGPDEPRPYRLLQTAFVDSVIRKPGEIIWLRHADVAAHHVAVEAAVAAPEEPQSAPDPAARSLDERAGSDNE